MRILVVDDSPTTRHLLTAILQRQGHQCSEAKDGLDALHRLAIESRPDVVLIDWHMPGMSGPELLHFLRNHPEYHDLRLVIVTRETDLSKVNEALAAGADEYIMKPFTPEVIEEKLQLLEWQ